MRAPIAWVAVVGLVAAGCGGSAGAAGPAGGRADRYLLRLDDLPPAWTVTATPTPACAGPPADAHSTGFATPDGKERIGSTVRLPTSAAAVADAMAAVRQPTFQDCWVKALLPASVGVVKREVAAVPSPLPASVDVRLTVSLADTGRHAYVDVMVEGDAHTIATLAMADVVAAGDIPSPDDGTLSQAADAVGRRILGQ